MYLSFFASGSKKLLNACVHYFKALDKLQIAVFNCYLQKDYVFKKYFYEQQMHKARLRLLYAMKKIRRVTGLDEKNHLAKLENLYEIIFSLNTLKLRITDHATFEVCETEFQKISQSLSKVLEHIAVFLFELRHQQPNISIDNITNPTIRHMLDDTAKIMGKLSNQTDRLEELYRSTLQVVSKDPIFFLFFVQSLIAFRDELESFFLGLLND